jgi:ABC-type Na+ efflux pump permease subunit
MVRDALFLTWADARHQLRSRETLLWAFVMPVVFAYFIGTIIGNYARSQGLDRMALLVPENAGFLADQLARRLEALDYQVVRVAEAADLEGYSRRLRIPRGFTELVLAGEPVTLTAERAGSGLDADYDHVRLSRAVYGVLADLIVLGKQGQPVTAAALEQLARRPRKLTLEVTCAGRRKVPPTGYEQSVPGSMVFLVLVVLFTSGVSLTMERHQGILRRLASCPMSRGAVVLGKWGARMTVGVLQIVVAMLAGTVLFGVRWGPNLPAVLAVLFAFASLAAISGMLLGNFGRTAAQVMAVGVLVANVLACLGGCWWPIEVAPAWAQGLAHFLPTGWVMDALHQLVNFGADPSAVLPQLAALCLSALAAGLLLARWFRFE